MIPPSNSTTLRRVERDRFSRGGPGRHVGSVCRCHRHPGIGHAKYLSLLIGLLSVISPTVVGHKAWAAPVKGFQPTAQDEFVDADAKLELVWGDGQFTEGPAATADGTILFSDIGNRIMQYDPRTGKTRVFRADSGRSNGMMFDAQGRLVVCEGANTGGRRRISITLPDGTVQTLADRYQGKRFNSPNDVAVAPSGRVYFTDPRYVGDEPRELDFEGVFVIEPDRTVQVATRDVEKPNGILVSADGTTVYVSDNNGQGRRELLAFAVAPDGTLHGKRVLWHFAEGERGIDGMTLDQEGNIYASAASGKAAGIYVFSPQGKPLAWIPIPGAPTNCVFGVGSEARVLYVTAPVNDSSRRGRQTTRGKYGLYRIELKKRGYHLFPQ